MVKICRIYYRRETLQNWRCLRSNALCSNCSKYILLFSMGVTYIGSRLCTFQWSNPSRCKAAEHYSPVCKWAAIRPVLVKWRSGGWGEKVAFVPRIVANWLGIGWVLYSGERIQCPCCFSVLQISRTPHFPARLRLFARYVFGWLFPWIDGMFWAMVMQITFIPRFLERSLFSRGRIITTSWLRLPKFLEQTGFTNISIVMDLIFPLCMIIRWKSIRVFLGVHLFEILIALSVQTAH